MAPSSAKRDGCGTPERIAGAACGSAVLPAAFISEGLWVYLHELHYYTTAALWIAIGVSLSLTMTWTTGGQRWLVPAVGAGLLAEIFLTQVYSRSF